MVRINQNTQKYGYVLGLPFLQAFHIVFDYENDRVGFANKKHGRQGAFVYGIPDPKPEEEKSEEEIEKEKEHNGHEDTDPIVDPTHPVDENEGEESTDHDSQGS